MTDRVLVSGSLAIDRIMDFPGFFPDHIVPGKLHVLNVSFHVESFQESFGGTAGNIAYSLGRLGLRPRILASIGSDAKRYEQHLRESGVLLDSVRRVTQTPTATAMIITDRADNQITGFYPGALMTPVSGGAIPNNADLAIVAPGNLEDMVRLPGRYRQRRIPFFFDPGQQIVRLSSKALKDGLQGSIGLLGNDYEIALIKKKTGLSKQALVKRAGMVITTLGSKGSLCETPTAHFRVPPAKPTKVLDPTGAGDAFRAGLLFGLIQGWPMQKAARFGSVVAVYAIETQGTQSPKLSRASAFTRYYRTFKERL